MTTKHIENTIQKTEEVQDIIDRMPRKTPRIVAMLVIILASFLFLSGWLINYPESVTGTVTISAQTAPVRLIAPTSGKLHLLHKNNEEVLQGNVIAYIESGANFRHVWFLDSLLQQDLIGQDVLIIEKSNTFVLGELTIPYLKVQNSLLELDQHNKNNLFVPKIKQLQVQKEGKIKQLDNLVNQQEIQEQQHIIYSNNLYKDSIQYFDLNSITETDYLRTKTAWLNSLQALRNQKNEKDLLQNNIKELDASFAQLSVEENEYNFKLSMNLQTSLQDLKNQVELWKQKYAFTAPYNGKLELLDFWKENAFVQAGKEAFAIIPAKNPVLAQVLLPSQGAGKVTEGQEVIIKLDNFPYLEYGSITGKVKSISMLTNQADELLAQKNIHSYKVNVELPDQLITNYGTSLDFNHDMKGMAQILVRKRRLIERLFDNLKYMVNE